MDFDEFCDALVEYGNKMGLVGEGIDVKVRVANDGEVIYTGPVTGLQFDGNTTLYVDSSAGGE